LYDGISAEHSSIDDIVRKARQLEKTLISLKIGRGTDKPSIPASNPSTGGGNQRSTGSQYKSRPRNTPTQRQQGQVSVSAGSRPQRTTTKLTSGDRGKATTQNQSAPKGDTSKLTCYKCGKVGHIASDAKCPQYKKPEQRQIFAAQVLDDRSETDQPNQMEPSENSEQPPEPNVEEEHDAAVEESSNQEDILEGSQYEGEGSSFDEYDGYAPPSEDEELEYIRAMGDDSETNSSFASSESSANTAPTQFDDVNWQTRRDIIRDCHKRAPWMPGADWEFTPQFGITHIRNCEVCAKYKEHLVVAEAINGATVSSAWKICDQFEEKLVRLGWDLAHEGGQLPHTTVDAITALESRNHQLKLQLAALHRASRVAAIRNKELLEALDHERLDNSLREGEIDFLQDECRYLQMRCTELTEQLTNNQQNILSPSKDEDVQMRAKTPDVETSTRSGRVESSFTPSVGVTPRANPTRLSRPENFPGDSSLQYLSDDAVARLAAARDDTITPREREFRAAQCRNFEFGERPRTFGSDRRCMAALVKINGLEAYALLDSGSTTVSVTHDFARVAKLEVMQLENPVPLQLGTVGSRSMINFGTKTRLELGPINEHDAYLDVVNIDRYDMIVGTPFMRKHGLVLNFADDTLSTKGEIIQTLTSGQEDLMLAKKRTLRARAPTTPSGHTTRASE
jgi:gag-polyprotein putative aspartyl protease/Zinc knuckle